MKISAQLAQAASDGTHCDRHLLQIVVWAAVALLSSCSSVRPVAQPKIGRVDRLEDSVQRAILGALVWLDLNQVRNRSGRGSSSRDASDLGDGCRNDISLSLPGGVSVPVRVPEGARIRNEEGGWTSEIHLLPHPVLFAGRGLIGVADANCFNTAFTAGPCYLIDDYELEPGKRFVSKMRREALKNLSAYRRGGGYAFWREMSGSEGGSRRTGPLNVPVPILRATAEVHLQSDCRGFAAAVRSSPLVQEALPLPTWLFWAVLKSQAIGRSALPPREWLAECLNVYRNPTGADALFNVPPDADDTAAVVVLQAKASAFGEWGTPDVQALQNLGKFRDRGRDIEDGRDAWKGEETGAFLTWMQDEEMAAFAKPEQGVIPVGVNNVDAVINANVAHSMAAVGLRDHPGWRDAVHLTARCALERTWPQAGLYYPQQMMFPYAASRMWRESMVSDPETLAARRALLGDLLRLQTAHGMRIGSFPGGKDPSKALATAMGLCALLNLGEATAKDIGEVQRYRSAIHSAVRRLLIMARRHRRDLGGPLPEIAPVSWEPGLFFSASFQDLAHWRSEALTTALAMEALAKYAMHCDDDQAPAGRLVIVPDTGRLALRPDPH